MLRWSCGSEWLLRLIVNYVQFLFLSHNFDTRTAWLACEGLGLLQAKHILLYGLKLSLRHLAFLSILLGLLLQIAVCLHEIVIEFD